MPVKVPGNLPARLILEQENIFVISNERAIHQDIRPIKIIILNLMPTKVATEVQLLRCLTNTPLQIEVDLLYTATHIPRHTAKEYLSGFYKEFREIKGRKYDGMIITGAPVENLEFEEVEYWQELCEIMEWSKTHVHSTLHLCWGAQAALYYHYKIPKYPTNEKQFGIFKHTVVNPNSKLFQGFNDEFDVPHSRQAEVRKVDLEKHPELIISALSEQVGVHTIESKDGKYIFAMGHAEYDSETLAQEYFRDQGKGLNPNIPKYYFKDDNVTKKPINKWRSYAYLFYANWVNYYLYQTVPYEF